MNWVELHLKFGYLCMVLVLNLHGFLDRQVVFLKILNRTGIFYMSILKQNRVVCLWQTETGMVGDKDPCPVSAYFANQCMFVYMASRVSI